VIIVVSDTSVLIDLERGRFREAVFSLSLELAVPDLLYERELKAHGGERLRELGLRVEALGAKETAKAVQYWRRNPVLSLPDCFALALAVEEGWMLLTGDGALRDLARTESVDCHGVLWVLDQLLYEKVVAPRLLKKGLEAIAAHPRCRLPRREMNARLERYAALLGKRNRGAEGNRTG
jgi:predicted nucleic acid-binding protein